MAIRTKAYRGKGRGGIAVRAIRITESNFLELTNYIARNGGEAIASSYIAPNGDELNHKIRIRQEVPTKTRKSKRDWRVARPGDFIVKYEDGSFARVKDDIFEASFELVK